jgi:hypothetical protein
MNDHDWRGEFSSKEVDAQLAKYLESEGRRRLVEASQYRIKYTMDCSAISWQESSSS